MTYSQTKDIPLMLDAHVKKSELILSKINSVTGVTMLRPNMIGRSMRPT